MTRCQLNKDGSRQISFGQCDLGKGSDDISIILHITEFVVLPSHCSDHHHIVVGHLRLDVNKWSELWMT